MDPKLEQLATYRAISSQSKLSTLNARAKVIPFQTMATPTPAGQNNNGIITIGEFPCLLNSIELGDLLPMPTDTLYPVQFYLQFNVFDADDLGLFGGDTSPRASTVFGFPQQIPYAIQPVKVFAPRSRIRLEWINQAPDDPLGFELFFNFIEVLDQKLAVMPQDELKDALEELLMERRVR